MWRFIFLISNLTLAWHNLSLFPLVLSLSSPRSLSHSSYDLCSRPLSSLVVLWTHSMDAPLLFFMLLQDPAPPAWAPQFFIAGRCWIIQLYRSDLGQALSCYHFSVKTIRAYAMVFANSSLQLLWKRCGWCLVQHEVCLKMPVPLSKTQFQLGRWKFIKFSCSRLALYVMWIQHSFCIKRCPENRIYLPIKSETEVQHPNHSFKQSSCFHRGWVN